jgi:hypothetical protein
MSLVKLNRRREARITHRLIGRGQIGAFNTQASLVAGAV